MRYHYITIKMVKIEQNEMKTTIFRKDVEEENSGNWNGKYTMEKTFPYYYKDRVAMCLWELHS